MNVPFAPEARLMRALAHAERLAIVGCLRSGSACVCHLTALLRRPQAYVSQQLAILRTAGLIEPFRDGGFTYYRLGDQQVVRLLEQASRLTGAPRDRTRAGSARRAERTAAERAAGCGCPRCRPSLAVSRRKSA